jgi:hypothetical protein
MYTPHQMTIPLVWLSFAQIINSKLKIINCSYDPAGRRIEKTFYGKYTVKYLYDGDDMIAEYHGSGKLLRKYIYGPRVDEPIRLRSGQAYLYD